MIKSSYFSTPFYLEMIEQDIKPLIDYAYELKEKSPGRQSTNVDAWQSNDLISSIVLEPFIKKFEDVCNELHQDMQLQHKQLIDNVWININPKGGFNKPHVHSDNVFSGVFYLQCDSNSGELVFTHPAVNHVYHFNDYTVEKYNNMNSGQFKSPPQERKLIVFPSYATHYVEPNRSDNDRISLAFNTKFKTI